MQYHSTYLAMGNNPINGIDPNGGFFQELKNWVLGRGWISNAGWNFMQEHPEATLNGWNGSRFSGAASVGFRTADGNVAVTAFPAVKDYTPYAVWNSDLMRTAIPADFVKVGGGFMGTVGVGTGGHFDLNWVIRGPQASLKPVITTTVPMGAGYDADASFNVGIARYTGSAKKINRDMLQTSIDVGLLGYYGSFGLNAGGDIDFTGSLVPLENGQSIIGTQIDFGAGLTPGPNVSGGVFNTWILHDFE